MSHRGWYLVCIEKRCTHETALPSYTRAQTASYESSQWKMIPSSANEPFRQNYPRINAVRRFVLCMAYLKRNTRSKYFELSCIEYR